ncbi:MFS transporter [Polycladomyces sp. WAk]|uniref:MFS transporter n=1 Tax=Polycladomyces zharkentensis TaxID=2807616 RepID=A0ABS2WL97_9BACL|nr:MDR family MFS transporter [Polycladomyces sp. WAk]MBN2910299.1 MFS transporter [Polycladomyces sp. WAk]
MDEKKHHVTFVLIGLFVGLLFTSLDQTVVSTAMPTIISDLGGMSFYSWVTAVYMLTETAGIPIFGKLADLYGRKKIYMIGMGIFVLGSVLCGLSTHILFLIFARGLQGIGAAAIWPLAMTIIGDVFPPEKSAKIQGIFGGAFIISSIAGPALGGILTESLSWHWIFFINIPFGIVSAFLLWKGLVEQKGEGNQSVDWAGAVTLTAGIILVLLPTVLTGGEDQSVSAGYDWSSPLVLLLLFGGLAILAIFIWVEMKAEEPVLPLRIFGNQTVTLICIISFFSGMGMFGAITFIPLYIQYVQHTSASIAGYALTPMMFGAIIAGSIGGFLITRIPYRTLLVTGLLFMSLGFYLMSTVNTNTSLWTIICYVLLIGMGMGILMSNLTTIMQAVVDKKHFGVATSSINFFRSIGATIGTSILGAVLNHQVSTGLGNVIRENPAYQSRLQGNIQEILRYGKDIPTDVVDQVVSLFVHSVQSVFLISLVMIVITLIVSLFLGKGKIRDPQPETNHPAE